MPSMLDTSAAGVYIIAATPFTEEGAVDSASLDRLMDFYVGCGITGVTVLGIMGEAPKLDAAESAEVAIRFVKRAKKMQVIVGVSAPGFAAMGQLAKAAMDAGAAGVMIAPASTARTDDQIAAYFEATALAGFKPAEARKFFGQPRGITVEMLEIAPMPATEAEAKFAARFHEI